MLVAAGRLLRNLPRLLAPRLTAWLVLMASGCRLLSSVASSALAAAASGRNSGDDRRLLFWLVHGSNQAGLLAMESPQLVRLNHQIPHILVVIFTQYDAKFGWQSAQEMVSEEDVCLLTVRASFQHGGQELQGPPGTEGLHLE